MNNLIYFDNHATTKIDQRVFDEMKLFYTNYYGNPSSINNYFGRYSNEAINIAREKVAKLINSDKSEIIFTSSATESNNLVIKGLAESNLKKGNHIITISTEHKSVLETCKNLEKYGFEITILNVDSFGNISIKDFTNAIKKETILVSIMMANNEIGTIHPISEIAKICIDKSILFHSDASQCGAYLEIDVKKINPTFLTLASHKMHGPHGASALFVKNGFAKYLSPQIFGAGQENNLRSGTQNLTSIVGFGKACEIALNENKSNSIKNSNFRDELQNHFTSLGDVKINGSENKLSNNLNVTIYGVSNKELINNTNKIIYSTGSACLNLMQTNENYSHVLKAIGLSKSEAYSTIRIGLSKFTTREEINEAKNIFSEAITNERKKQLIKI